MFGSQKWLFPRVILRLFMGVFIQKKDTQDAGMSAPIGLGGELVRGNHDVPFPCWEICGPAVSDDYMSLDNPRRLPEAFNVTWMSFVDGYEYHCEGGYRHRENTAINGRRLSFSQCI
ncbi:hypothetical protein QIU19_02940 [Capnocytophaga canimorsus]|nr:hypothetical protein [Capnocytophaga canimorsus]WGU68896.1 hypothetical protein QIU19_02940 [Capnocytophaga canimorsus]